MPDIEKWKYLDACSPFIEDDKYYIVIDSEYTTPGDDPETRYAEAQRFGVSKLLEFYGKDTSVLDDTTGIITASSFEDKYVTASEENLVPMKVLISVLKEDFDLVDDDPTTCSIDIPENKVVIEYPVNEIAKKIDLVVSGMATTLLDALNSQYFISNIYIEKEMARLSQARTLLQNYFNLNNIEPFKLQNPDCSIPSEQEKTLTLGFDTDYKLRYLLIDNQQHTIGYNCLLEQSVFSHITTTYYLTRLDDMILDLKDRVCDEFNWINFYKIHTLPIPIIEAKEHFTDGVNHYDENGNYTTEPTPPVGDIESSTNELDPLLGELINKLGKTDEELSAENQKLNDPIVRTVKAENAKIERDYVGAEETSPAAIEQKLDELNEISSPVSPNTEEDGSDLLTPQQLLENNNQKNSLFKKLNFTFNVLGTTNIGLMSQQVIPTMINCLINEYGLEMWEDPDLQTAFNLQDCQLDKTTIQEKFGSFSTTTAGIVPQIFNIPPYFPNNKDYLAVAMDQLRANLANLLLQTTISTIVETFQNYIDNVYSNPCQVVTGPDPQFRNWLSQTVGIDLPNIDNPETFASLMIINGGKGFSGILSNILSKTNSPSRLEAAGFELSDLPTPGSLPIYINDFGAVRQKYLPQQHVVTVTNEILKGLDEISSILMPRELALLLAGRGDKNTNNLATTILTRNASKDNLIFRNREDVIDVLQALGRMISPKLLMEPVLISTAPDNVERLTVGDSVDLLRKQILKRQDPLIPDAEIEQIIQETRQKAKDKILKAVDLFNKYNGGELLPSFPDLFGSGGLIKNIPPVVKEVSEKTSEAVVDPIIETFYSDVAPTVGTGSYINWWNQSLGQIGYLYNLPSLIFDSFSLEAKNDEYLLGYTPATTQRTETPGKTLIGTTPGYNFGRNFNVDNKGLDDDDAAIVFAQIKEAFGVTDSLENWYYGNIASYIEDFDTGGGIIVATEEILDPFDENILYELEVDRTDKSNKIATIRRYTLDSTQQTNARPPGYSDDIVTLSLRSNLSYQQIDYKSNVYKIGTTLSSLGDKSTTGELGTRSFNSGFDIDNLQDLDFNNLKSSNLGGLGGVGLFGSKINSTSVNSSIITQFVEYIKGQKYSSATKDSNTNIVSSDFNVLNLSLDNDIFDVKGLKADAVNTMNFLLNGSLTGEYCDSLSEIRRNTLNTSLRLLVRAYIIEQALISIQVFNGFDLAFMDNQIFANSVYSLLKKEISKYQESFDTLESSLLIDIKEAALKYYEIMNLSGQSEETPSSGKDAVRQMILDEAKVLKEPITLALNLDSSTDTWNEFLTKVIFGEYQNSTYGVYVGTDLVSFPYLNPVGTETSFTQRTDTIMQYGGSTYIFVRDRKVNDDGSRTYSYSLVYIEKQSILSQIDNWTSDYIIYDEDTVRRDSVAGDEPTPTGWEGTTILSVECTREDTADDEDEVYDSLAKLMFETDEYKKVFNDISPVKVFISCLSLYQASALSDPATFSYFGGSSGEIPYIGADLNDFMAKTKLTILQLFASSIYGGGKIDYQDPFLQKAQP